MSIADYKEAAMARAKARHYKRQRGRKDLFFIGVVYPQRITPSGSKARIWDAYAKQGAVSLQRPAPKTQVGSNRKGCGRNAKVGSKRKRLLYSAGKTQRNALVKLCDAPEEALSALPMDLSITIKNGSKEPK